MDRTEVEELRAALKQECESKNNAYLERNRLVALLAALYPAVLARHPEVDTDWEPDWCWLVQIELPTGQATWHLHDSHLALFAHVPHGDNRWDGHTTPEKYERISRLVRSETV